MLQNIITTGFLLGLISMLFVTPYMFSVGILKLEYGVVYNTDRVKSFLPIYNVAHAEHLYTNKISKVGIAYLSFLLITILRVGAVFLLSANKTVQLVTIILFILSLLSLYITNVWLIFYILRDAGTVSMVALIFYSLVFPLGQYYIGNYLPTVVKHYCREEETF